MNINKNIAHFIIGSLFIGLAVTVLIIISQQKNLMKLYEQTSRLLDEQKKALATKSSTKKKLSSKSLDAKDLQPLYFNIEPESTSKDLVIRPSKDVINNAIESAYAQPKQISGLRSLASQLNNSENKSLGTQAQSSKPEDDQDMNSAAKKTVLYNDQISASPPTQTLFPYNPLDQRRDIPKNSGIKYDSKPSSNSTQSVDSTSSVSSPSSPMMVPVVFNNPPVTNSNTGTGTGAVDNSINPEPNLTTSQTLENILSTLQFQIPAQGGTLINNGSVNQNRSHRIKRNRSSTKEYWTSPFIISTDDPTFDEVSVIRLQENITFKPEDSSKDNNAAIIINKDNTTIDLYGFSLSLDDSGLDQNTIIDGIFNGIFICPGITNTKIISSAPQETKGQIKGFTGYGIYAEGLNNNDENKSNIKQVEIKNILITENYNGIYLKNVSFAKINDLKIVDNVNILITDTYGIYCLNSNGITINECKVNKNISNFNIFGICIQDCVGTSILNSQANFNESIQGGNAIGMQITACHENTIFNCQANANLCAYANSVESIGFHITNESSNNVIEKCSSSANKHRIPTLDDYSPQTFPKGYGFKLENSNHNQVHNNTSTTQFNYGFYDDLIGSTTIYTGNKAFYNPTKNYSIFFTTGTGAIEPLPTTIMYPGDLSSLSGSASSLINIEIKAAL